MLQNPRVAFRDPRLQQGRIEKDEKGQPRPWAGAFAVVYKGINADGGEPFAARVFTSESFAGIVTASPEALGSIVRSTNCRLSIPCHG